MDASEKKPKQRHWMVRFLLSKGFIIAAAIMVAYTLAGFFLAPWLIKRNATRFAEETLGCRLVMEKVRMNPYALTLDIRNFDLKESDGSPLAAFEEFFVNFQVSSLWRWALTFADVRLERPSIHMEVLADGGINLVDLVDRIPRNEAGEGTKGDENGNEDAAPLRVILDHIVLNQGRFVFTDLSDPTHASVTLEPLGLELKNFTTLPDKKGMHAFEATLPHGGAFRWAGEMSTRPLWSEGEIAVTGFNLGTAWEFLQDEILVERPEGKIDLSARYRLAHGHGSTTLFMDDLKVLISGMLIKRRGGTEPVFAMDAIALDQGRFDLATREVSVGRLAFSRGSVAAAVNEQGRLNFQELMAVGPQADPVPVDQEGSDESPWRIGFREVDLDSVSLKFVDQSRPHPFHMGAARLGMNLRAELALGPQQIQAVVEDAGISLSDVSLTERGQDDPLVHLEQVLVEGGRMDLDARQIHVERVALDGGHARVSREKEGTINLARVLGGEDSVPVEMEGETGQGKDSQPGSWAIAVNAVEATGLGVGVEDENLSPTPTLDLENIALKASHITSNFKDPIPFEASFTVKQGGTVKAKGGLTLAEKGAEADIQVTDLTLTPIQPYLKQVAFLNLRSGALSVKGKATHKEDESGPHTTFAGKGVIHDLLVSESKTDEPFLSWKEMQVNDLKMSMAPDRVEVGEVRLKEFYGKLIIYEDQSVNLKKVLRPQKKKAVQDKPAVKGETPEGFPVKVGKIRIEKSGLDFADLSLRPQFAAKIHELKGAVVGLSTKAGTRSQVELDGRVDAYGTARIRGELAPFDAKAFTDITMTFRNVEMTNLTPYSARFAGYEIASGKLSLDLRYLIRNSQLDGENQIILDRLILGEKVDNPDAPDLPLHLALALLKDADDRIDIGLPVSGNLDDPEFTYGHLIWKALLNLFKKIVTAPFRALSAMLGVEDQDLDVIAFEPGSADLSPPEQEKVKDLSEALAKRPQLVLQIQGGYDPTSDGAALKTRAVRREIAKRAGKEVSLDQEAEPVDLNDPLIQKAVEDLVRERLSPQTLVAAKEEMAKQAAEAAKKGDKKSGPALAEDLKREFYASLLQKLMDAHPVAETELTAVGRKRAEAVKEALMATGKVGEGRLSILEPSETDKKGSVSVPTRLTLDVVQGSAGKT